MSTFVFPISVSMSTPPTPPFHVARTVGNLWSAAAATFSLPLPSAVFLLLSTSPSLPLPGLTSLAWLSEREKQAVVVEVAFRMNGGTWRSRSRRATDKEQLNTTSLSLSLCLRALSTLDQPVLQLWEEILSLSHMFHVLSFNRVEFCREVLQSES